MSTWRVLLWRESRRRSDEDVAGAQCMTGVQTDASLEEELDELITCSFDLVLHQYPNATTLAIGGLVKGPGAGTWLIDTLQILCNIVPILRWRNKQTVTTFTKTPLLWVSEQLSRSLPTLNQSIDCTAQVVEERLNFHTSGTIARHAQQRLVS